MNSIMSFFVVVINCATPILFVALGVLIMQLSGVLNIGAEGMMLMGAFFGVVGSALTESAWLGALLAMVVTGVIGVLFSLFTIRLQANQVVVGIAFNIISLGLTTTFYRMLFGMSSSTDKVVSFGDIGPLPMLAYIGIILVFILHFFLYKTKIGLRIRGVGEDSSAIHSMGMGVQFIRFYSVLIGAMLIGLGGCYLSLGNLSFFTEDMAGGRGYIALAAVIFGRYTSMGTWLAVLVFGTGEALVYRIQASSLGIPTQLVLMLPYIITIVAVSVFGKKGAEPEELGVPYKN